MTRLYLWACIALAALLAIGFALPATQTLIAGLLGLIGGLSAYVGALIAADRQVKAARQAAKDQVAAVQSQLEDARAAREENEKHKRAIERAYVSGGGARVIERRPAEPMNYELEERNIGIRELADGSRILLFPANHFRLDINNLGKTPARLHHVAVGFCDASAPPSEPVYEDPFRHDDALGPGVQSRVVKHVEIPPGRYARTAIYGRYYWDDIWDRHWSSGFIYEIGPGDISLSIEAPAAYWEDRLGDYPVGSDGR